MEEVRKSNKTKREKYCKGNKDVDNVLQKRKSKKMKQKVMKKKIVDGGNSDKERKRERKSENVSRVGTNSNEKENRR